MTEFDAEPMPNMEEIINRKSGHKYFTKMDLSKGYWQVGLTERSKPLTAFETSGVCSNSEQCRLVSSIRELPFAG